jgi:hypothetical protein
MIDRIGFLRQGGAAIMADMCAVVDSRSALGTAVSCSEREHRARTNQQKWHDYRRVDELGDSQSKYSNDSEDCSQQIE